MIKILGIWNGHDSNACLLKNGIPIIHLERERFTRIKHDNGDMVDLFNKNYSNYWKNNLNYIVSIFPEKKLIEQLNSFNELKQLNIPIHFVPHHLAHGANAFYSSLYKKSLILTLDGGGCEENNIETAATVLIGDNKTITRIKMMSTNQINIGGAYSRYCRYIFEMSNGKPAGDNSAQIMAMAGFSNSTKYLNDFRKMLTTDLLISSQKPVGQVEPFVKGNDPTHPYLDKWQKLARSSQQEMFDIAAGLQQATEEIIKNIIQQAINLAPDYSENLCLAGGVSLNCTAVGKIKSWFPQIKNIYLPPTVSDCGLALGAAQYFYHHILKNERINWDENFSPYLGKEYTEEEIKNDISKYQDKIVIKQTTDEEVIKLLEQQNIISIYNGRSEVGYRALGNRSIVADPRSLFMKDKINQKVKARANYRPFAPAILREEVTNWFEEDCDSPYMQFVLKYKADKKDLVPAVCHVDGTGRLQTVTEKLNPWWYNFIKKWHKISGVPILLNTSLNSRTPICETITHVLDCFFQTDIDLIYLPEFNILITRK